MYLFIEKEFEMFLNSHMSSGTIKGIYNEGLQCHSDCILTFNL